MKTHQEAPSQELVHSSKGKNTEVELNTETRPLSLAELMRVAGGPTIKNDN